MGAGGAAPSSKSVVKGAAWAAIDNWTQQGVGLITFIVIGSIIGPRLYGVMAMGMLYHLLLASVIRDTYGEALIQRRILKRAHYDTIFWTLLGLGTLLMLLSIGLAGPVAAMFSEPELAPIISYLGLTFPLLGASNFYRSMLRRQMNFKALAIRSVFACGLSAVIAITLAAQGYGIWSLVIYQLCYHALDLAAVAFQSKWAPRFRFSIKLYRELEDFSYKTMGNYALANIGGQIDRFLIGYFLGAGSLGLYTMARRIVDALDQTAVGVISAVGLPTFSRIQHVRTELQRLLYGSTHFSMLIACPAYAGLGLVAPTLIDVVLPDEWQATAPILALLCFSGFFFPAVAFLSSCQRSIGQAGLLLALGVGQMTLRLVLCLAAVLMGQGVIGIVIAIAIASLALVPIRIYFARKAMGLSAKTFLASLAAPIGASLIMVVAVLGLRYWLEPQLSEIALLAAMIATGVATYLLALALISPRSLGQVFVTLSRKKAMPQDILAPSAIEPGTRSGS